MCRTVLRRALMALLAACVVMPMFGCSGSGKSLEDERKSESPEMQQQRKAKEGK